MIEENIDTNKNIQQNLEPISFKWYRVLIVLAFFALGYLAGRSHEKIIIPREISNSTVDFNLFWDSWSILEEKYPFNEPPTEEKIFSAIAGLAASYKDEHTIFLRPDQSNYFNENVEGKFGGIGAEISILEGYLVVVAPLKNSPSEQAGLKAGDIIVSIDGKESFGTSIDDAIKLLRGEIGTEVKLEVARKSITDLVPITITRAEINIPILDFTDEDGIFTISLYNFNENSEYEFKKAIEAFAQSSSDKLIIHLRNNPGGYLDAAVKIASYFLPQGEIIVIEDYGNSGKKADTFRSFGYENLKNKKFQSVVIINQGSASASEIVAAALQDHKKATIVGETSYGKGSVQEYIEMPEGGALKVTVGKWLTPLGAHIDAIGVKPDYLFEQNDIIDNESTTTNNVVDSVFEQTKKFIRNL